MTDSRELPLLSDEREYLSGARSSLLTLQRSKYDLRAVLAAFFSIILAAITVTTSILLCVISDDQVDVNNASQDRTLVAFQILHLTSFIVILIGTSFLMLRTWRGVFSLQRRGIFSPASTVTVALLLLVGGANIVFNIIQLAAPVPGIDALKVAESIWTVPESTLIVGLLVSLELVGKNQKHHFRRAKIVILPAIIGVSLSAIILNVVGIDTRDNNPGDFTRKAQIPIILSATFRAGSLLLATEHFLKAIQDVVMTPNRHVPASQLDGPLDSGSGQYRKILGGASDAVNSTGVFSVRSDSGESGSSSREEAHDRFLTHSSHSDDDGDIATATAAEAVSAAGLAERVQLNAAQAARDVVQAIQAAAASRAALSGRRPLFSLVASTVSLVLFVMCLPSVFVEGDDTMLVRLRQGSIIAQSIINLAVFWAFAAFAAKPGQCRPLEVPTGLAKELPGVTSVIRALIPALGAAIFQGLVHFDSDHPTRDAEAVLMIIVALAQGSVNAYLLANAPLCIILPSEEEGGSGGAAASNSGRISAGAGGTPTAVQALLADSPALVSALEANKQPIDSVTGRPLTAKQMLHNERIQSVIQLFAIVNSALNLTALLLPIVPGVEEFEDQLKNFPISLAARAVAAFFYAFSCGVALNATRSFSILTTHERELQSAALRVMYAPRVPEEAANIVMARGGGNTGDGGAGANGSSIARPPGLMVSVGAESLRGSFVDSSSANHAASLNVKSLPRGITAGAVAAAMAANAALRSSAVSLNGGAASGAAGSNKLELTRQASAQALMAATNGGMAHSPVSPTALFARPSSGSGVTAGSVTAATGARASAASAGAGAGAHESSAVVLVPQQQQHAAAAPVFQPFAADARSVSDAGLVFYPSSLGAVVAMPMPMGMPMGRAGPGHEASTESIGLHAVAGTSNSVRTSSASSGGYTGGVDTSAATTVSSSSSSMVVTSGAAGGSAVAMGAAVSSIPYVGSDGRSISTSSFLNVDMGL